MHNCAFTILQKPEKKSREPHIIDSQLYHHLLNFLHPKYLSLSLHSNHTVLSGYKPQIAKNSIEFTFVLIFFLRISLAKVRRHAHIVQIQCQPNSKLLPPSELSSRPIKTPKCSLFREFSLRPVDYQYLVSFLKTFDQSWWITLGHLVFVLIMRTRFFSAFLHALQHTSSSQSINRSQKSPTSKTNCISS